MVPVGMVPEVHYPTCNRLTYMYLTKRTFQLVHDVETNHAENRREPCRQKLGRNLGLVVGEANHEETLAKAKEVPELWGALTPICAPSLSRYLHRGPVTRGFGGERTDHAQKHSDEKQTQERRK